MASDLQQQLAASSLYDAESLKAFNQMYNSSQNPYGNGFDKNYPASALPFFQHFAPYTNPNATASSFSPSGSSTSSTSSQQHQHPTKKKPVPVPAEQKDETYFERRRRNNEAARKSREARRKQDNDNGTRVIQLEQENQNLKAYIWNLYNENVMMKHQLTQRYAAVDPNTAMPNF